jgi:hypothetical protein
MSAEVWNFFQFMGIRLPVAGGRLAAEGGILPQTRIP